MSEYHDSCARLVGNLADEFMAHVVSGASEAELREMFLRYIRQARATQALRAEHLKDVQAVHMLAAEVAMLAADAQDLTNKGAQDLAAKVQLPREVLPTH